MVEPSVWGKHAWKFMHSVTMGYSECPTDNEKKNMKTFFTSIQDILPCARCRENLKKHLKKYPINDEVVCSRESLVKWLINIHNEVNMSLGKKPYGHRKAIGLIMGKADKENMNQAKTLSLITILLISLCILYLLYKKYNRMSHKANP